MSMYIWHFPCYQMIRIFSGIVPIHQFYTNIWFYLVVISFIVFTSVFSSTIIEPKLNKAIENIIYNLHI